MTFDNPSLPADASAEETPARRSVAFRFLDWALPSSDVGRLQLVLPTGEVIDRSGEQPGPEATISVHRWRALWRMLRHGEHGFADGYLDGDWSATDLSKLLEFFMRNEATVAALSEGSRFTRIRNRLLHRRRENTRHGSRRNIAAHYDLGNAFYGQWLDRGMNYSSALYGGEETLETAQEAKLDRVAHLLEIGGNESILEIGCGWGSLAERLIRRHGCSVSGITLSTEQLAYAKTRLSREAEDGRADLRLLDYRDVAGRYDRIASIEMFEAVGEQYWSTYFGKLRDCLREGGIAVLQVITIADSRYTAYRERPDFIQRYIFPGGMLPTASILEKEATEAGLKLVHQESFGDSYVRTLREWRDRFLRAWPKIENLGFDQRFQRMWEYYLTYCEVGFHVGAIDVRLVKLAR